MPKNFNFKMNNNLPKKLRYLSIEPIDVESELVKLLENKFALPVDPFLIEIAKIENKELGKELARKKGSDF